MVTYGFYDSIDHDRRYNTEQFGSIFDGVIRDGVFMHVGDCFRIYCDGTMTVNVGTGRAWFLHTWTLNDSKLPLTIPDSEVLLDRYDSIVLDVNKELGTRANDIFIVKGTPSSKPEHPTLIYTDEHRQYPIAYVLVKAGTTAITAAEVTSMVGLGTTPFVTGVLESMSIDQIVENWEMQWKWQLADQQQEFQTWFDSIKGTLEGDVAANLAAKIADLETHAILDSSYGIVPEEPPVFEPYNIERSDQNG